MYERRYEQTGDEAMFTATVRELKLLHEIDPKNPSTNAIVQELIRIRQAKQGAGAAKL